MDKIILGILLLKKMTVYEIRAYVKQNMKSMCSDSMGSIQAALKKLMSSGHVTVSEFVERGVNKKEYQISKLGRDVFAGWLRQPMDLSKSKNMEEGKFFFMGFIPREERLHALEAYLQELKEEQAYLLGIQQALRENEDSIIEYNVNRVQADTLLKDNLLSVTEKSDLKEAFGDIYGYQVHTLKYGIEKVAFDIQYFEQLLKAETESGNKK